MDGAIQVGQVLMDMVSEDDREYIHGKLDEMVDRFERLFNSSEQRADMLMHGLENLEQFDVSAEEFIVWLEEMESRMQSFNVLAVFVEPLQKQQDQFMV